MRVLILYSLLFLSFFSKAQAPFTAVRAGIQSDNFDAAKEVLDSCSFKNYCQDSVLYYRGLLILKKGNLKSARTICSSLQKTYPAFLEAHYLSALIYFVNENYGSSIEEFTFLIKNNPNHLKALYNRALAYGMLEDYLSAIEDLTSCVTISPNYSMGYYSRAYWYEYTGNYTEAKKDYGQSIKLDPKNFDAYFGLAYIYQNEKANEKACEIIADAIAAGSQIAVELKENFCH